MTHLSVIVNAHNEGLLLTPSLLSAARATAFARSAGYTVEVLVVLDRPGSLTREVAQGAAQLDMKLLEVDYGDLGRSRNAGVGAANSRYIAFLDGDDLWGETWLKMGLDAAIADSRPIVWHPEISVYFGARREIMTHPDMEAEDFDTLSLVAANPWTALCLTQTSLLRQVPYPETDLANRIGFEDWGWHRLGIEAGMIHKVVKGTGHAIRVKLSSLGKSANAAGAIPSPTALFRQSLPLSAEENPSEEATRG
ncbi:glycosyltransferase family 2 protein [Asticcacaulis sp. AND118]|uniref:glycosyltransferase family 2 protein n=1 Tax=Asticcacaulis sp. AND118 TaxID=2840468 RepID=UPI001CFFA150|nr:glycosyltransferase family 2 protein [Asticcacaulis sp. AND118]UDF03381.1 glycosyltransferase [Asticcacaulis sp. AND118]